MLYDLIKKLISWTITICFMPIFIVHDLLSRPDIVSKQRKMRVIIDDQVKKFSKKVPDPIKF